MIRLRQINVNVLEDSKEKLIEKCSKKLRINSKEIKDIEIVKKSTDNSIDWLKVNKNKIELKSYF